MLQISRRLLFDYCVQGQNASFDSLSGVSHVPHSWQLRHLDLILHQKDTEPLFLYPIPETDRSTSAFRDKAPWRGFQVLLPGCERKVKGLLTTQHPVLPPPLAHVELQPQCLEDHELQRNLSKDGNATLLAGEVCLHDCTRLTSN